ncbi:MAG: LD-carboxypeptidase [Clostridia bacterium]|nr:LD-carboxypeptidase [Clostridia bacterium]
MIPKKLELGDTIGVVAPSNPIVGDNIEELERAKEIVEKCGFKVKFSKHIFSNTLGYSSTAQEKAEDIMEMFQDKEVKMIWCAKGGENSNSTFDFLDYETIKLNPKIICGYSDINSITSMINAKTGLVTFYGTNFKTIATDETDYSYQEALKRFVKESLELGIKGEEYKIIQKGQAEGKLIGGNLSIIKGMVEGKYKLDFKDKILFLEEFGFETSPTLANNYLYYMKQNGIFEQIKGLWIGNYQHESKVTLEQIVLDVIGNKYQLPIIQSNNFGHIETKTVIPIGTKARIDTNQSQKVKLMEQCVE